MLYHARLDKPENITLSVYSVPDLARPKFAEAITDKTIFKPAKVGESFGPSWVR
jgi:alpha-mannosidase